MTRWILALAVLTTVLCSPARADILPEIRLIPDATMQKMRCGDKPCNPVSALYNPASQTIFLEENWKPDSVRNLSVLLHEFVHHLQIIGHLEYECLGAMEAPAYATQTAFLKAHGEPPYLEEFTLFFVTMCEDGQ